MRRDKIVKEIYDKVVDALYEKVDDDFDFEEDGEFGGVDASISVIIDYKTCQIQCGVSYNAHNKNWIEVIIDHDNENHNLSNLEEAVNDYFEKNFDFRSLLDAMEDKVIEAEEDEWTSHGFRDAADYYHWRYG